MKLSHRIFLGYLILVAIAGYFLFNSVRDELRPAVRQSLEEAMVDTANLLAEMVVLTDGKFNQPVFEQSVARFLNRSPGAKIWGLDKNSIAQRIYITNEKGIVLYDSNQGKAVGEDYSQWRDVHRTLRGKYGARTTRIDPEDENSSFMHVAAPIYQDDKIIGVLTVSKPSISVQPFIRLSQKNIAKAGAIMLLVALLLGWLLSYFLTRSTRSLVHYASEVAAGKKTPLPQLSEGELAQLGKAMETMRQSLEDKAYVENYVHSLTHEIKSPLSGITGAAELLSEEMDSKDRARFMANILQDTKRIQRIIDRLLELAKLEQQKTLETTDDINLNALVQTVVDAKTPRMKHKKISCKIDLSPNRHISGDAFLLEQALSNILDNAIDFSPKNGKIIIRDQEQEGTYSLTITDQGPGIPDYAQSQIFERFYSLPRPDNGKKSSGLGLNFVKEVMLLHQGEVRIESSTDGTTVILNFT